VGTRIRTRGDLRNVRVAWSRGRPAAIRTNVGDGRRIAQTTRRAHVSNARPPAAVR
jgi:hypothetical protein